MIAVASCLLVMTAYRTLPTAKPKQVGVDATFLPTLSDHVKTLVDLNMKKAHNHA